MKLQKQLSRRVDGKEYPKYVVTVAPKDVEKLGWKEGLELNAYIDNGKLILKPTEKEKQ